MGTGMGDGGQGRRWETGMETGAEDRYGDKSGEKAEEGQD